MGGRFYLAKTIAAGSVPGDALLLCFTKPPVWVNSAAPGSVLRAVSSQFLRDRRLSVATNRLWNKTFPVQHSADSLFLFSCFSLSFWLLPSLFPHFVSCESFLLVLLCPFSSRPLKQARPRFGWALPLLRRSKSVPDSPLAPFSGHGSSCIPKASSSVGILTESLVIAEWRVEDLIHC